MRDVRGEGCCIMAVELWGRERRLEMGDGRKTLKVSIGDLMCKVLYEENEKV